MTATMHSGEIYDKTGCEKQYLPKSKKRSRTISTAVEKRHKTRERAGNASTNKGSTNNQALSGTGPSDASFELSHCCLKRNDVKADAKDSAPLCPDAQPLPVNGCTEELLCIVDRGIGSMEEEGLRATFDLSNFEMCKENNILSDGVSKICQMLAGNGDKPQISPGTSQSPAADTILVNSESEACHVETKDTATICPGERLTSIQKEQLPISQGLIQPMELQMSADEDDTAGTVTEEHVLKMQSSLLLHTHDFVGAISTLGILCDPNQSVSGDKSKEDAKVRIDRVEQVGTASNFDAYARRDTSSSSVANCSCTVKLTAV